MKKEAILRQKTINLINEYLNNEKILVEKIKTEEVDEILKLVLGDEKFDWGINKFFIKKYPKHKTPAETKCCDEYRSSCENSKRLLNLRLLDEMFNTKNHKQALWDPVKNEIEILINSLNQQYISQFEFLEREVRKIKNKNSIGEKNLSAIADKNLDELLWNYIPVHTWRAAIVQSLNFADVCDEIFNYALFIFRFKSQKKFLYVDGDSSQNEIERLKNFMTIMTMNSDLFDEIKNKYETVTIIKEFSKKKIFKAIAGRIGEKILAEMLDSYMKKNNQMFFIKAIPLLEHIVLVFFESCVKGPSLNLVFNNGKIEINREENISNYLYQTLLITGIEEKTCDNITHLFEMILIKRNGFNIRNLVSHGRLEDRRLNSEALANAMFSLFCLLFGLNIELGPQVTNLTKQILPQRYLLFSRAIEIGLTGIKKKNN